jgi:tRNA U34 5-methylaminomethyl-2-thiouridine-forming methyltransferase MnmC
MTHDRYIEQTADGSHTLYVPALDEHYHSVTGAVQESLHVFIDAGLKRLSSPKIRVLEIGFGTGLNAFLTYHYAQKAGIAVAYTAIELYPLALAVIRQLNYSDRYSLEEAAIFDKLHASEWEKPVSIAPAFMLDKRLSDLTRLDCLRQNELFDLIYFDAFAPDKQPEMWTQAIFDYLYEHTAQSGILTTYCAKGMVRRALRSAGYTVERLPGPPGKREMLRAGKTMNDNEFKDIE